jgi:hypothetical protein
MTSGAVEPAVGRNGFSISSIMPTTPQVNAGEFGEFCLLNMISNRAFERTHVAKSNFSQQLAQDPA